MLYAFKVTCTNIQSEVTDKSAIISSQRWTNSGGSPLKDGWPLTFVNEGVVRILKKVVHIHRKKTFNVVVNFETKEQRRLGKWS